MAFNYQAFRLRKLNTAVIQSIDSPLFLIPIRNTITFRIDAATTDDESIRLLDILDEIDAQIRLISRRRRVKAWITNYH